MADLIGMMIARSVSTVRNYYTGELNQIMFTKYIKSLSREDCPVVLSITNTTPKAGPVIQRNHVIDREQPNDIYVRAREIYYRARRQRPVRAASIF